MYITEVSIRRPVVAWGKIKPIQYGSKQNSSGWGKKDKSTKEENNK